MRIILIVLLMTLASKAHSGFCQNKWYATITDEVRVNSKGERLTTIGQVLAQERYKYWIDNYPHLKEQIEGKVWWDGPKARVLLYTADGHNPNPTFHYKGNRDELTKISGNKFYISTKERKAFWECSKIRFKIIKSGLDCEADATNRVEMWPLMRGSHQCFK